MIVKELLKENIRRVEKAYSKRSMCSGNSTGIECIDRCIDGLHDKDFIVFAARPEMGKTDILVNVALHLGTVENLSVAFFSLKLPADNITRKLICAKSRVNYNNYSRGLIKEDEWQKLMMAAGSLHDSNIYIDDSPRVNINDIKAKIYKLGKDKHIKYVLIDSLQHLLVDNKTADEISELTRELKSLAKELNIAIIATSQLSREVELRVDKRPRLNDLDKWICLNDDADVIALMYYEQYYNEDTTWPGTVDINIVKNRKGPVSLLRLRYLPECSCFEDIIDVVDADLIDEE